MFGPRVAAPAGHEQSGPLALTNSKGEVVLVYKDGQEVTWALYTAEGKLDGKAGKAGQLPGSNKVTAFVGADDNFYLVY